MPINLFHYYLEFNKWPNISSESLSQYDLTQTYKQEYTVNDNEPWNHATLNKVRGRADIT